MAPRVLILVSMYRYMDSDFKFVKHFTPDLNVTFTIIINKMVHVKSNSLHIFLTIYLEGRYMDSFVKIYVCCGTPG